jgi:hypothetical protein
MWDVVLTCVMRYTNASDSPGTVVWDPASDSDSGPEARSLSTSPTTYASPTAAQAWHIQKPKPSQASPDASLIWDEQLGSLKEKINSRSLTC